MHAFLGVLSHSPRLEKCSLYFAIPHCHDRRLLRGARAILYLDFPLLKELTLFDTTLNLAYFLRHIRFPTTTKTLLKADVPPDQLDGLLSTLFPPNSPIFGRATRLALQHNPAREFKPALEIGETTVQYLDEWDQPPFSPNDIEHTTFTVPLVEAVHRVGHQIRVLRIRLECGLVIRPEVWKDVLEHLPNLEELIYAPGREVDHQWPVFWNLLCQTSGRDLIYRSLRTLRIINPKGIPSDPVGCLAVRWKLGRPLDVFHLRVENCEHSLTRQVIAHLRHFVVQLVFEVIEEAKVVSLASR